MRCREFYKPLYVDIDKNITTPIHVTQGDTKTRGFLIQFLRRGKKLSVKNWTLFFYAEKPDKTRVVIEGVLEDDIFIIDLTNQVFAVPGIVLCELSLVGEIGQQITSKEFLIKVRASLQENAIVSKDERGFIGDLMNFADELSPVLDKIQSTDFDFIFDLEQEVKKAAETYVHNQIMSSNKWIIEHNLDNYPAVSIIDSGNNVVIGDVEYVSKDKVVVRFSAEFGGKAFLR